MTIKNLKSIYPEIKYVCIGDGEEKDNLQNLKKQLKLEDNIVFFYTTNEELKTALLDEANLFLMPAVKEKRSVEGFGIVREDGKAAVMMPANDELIRIHTENNNDAQ